MYNIDVEIDKIILTYFHGIFNFLKVFLYACRLYYTSYNKLQRVRIKY